MNLIAEASLGRNAGSEGFHDEKFDEVVSTTGSMATRNTRHSGYGTEVVVREFRHGVTQDKDGLNHESLRPRDITIPRNTNRLTMFSFCFLSRGIHD